MVAESELRENDELFDKTLKEENQRTRRYVITMIAVFVSLFGLCEALARGTPEYGYFLPGIFFYIYWIVYAFQADSRPLDLDSLEEIKQTCDGFLVEIAVDPATTPTAPSAVGSPKPSTSSYHPATITHSMG